MKTITASILAIFMFAGCKDKEDAVLVTEPCHCNGLPKNYTDSTGFLVLPTAFTPNGDGLNDLFRPVITPGLITPGSYLLSITAGNDAVLFQTTDTAAGWNGNDFGGVAAMAGMHFFTVQFITPTGDTVDDCGCITVLPHGVGCSITNGKTYYFEDQFNAATGLPQFATAEPLCP
ncbi:MAG: hypothetical protein EOP49_03745 [Sphingobacteriales bacterium]|nr:MAG: hypothetical protein EOP49_03745 [Sphingobacteriales bacterium]